jgi:hypothetical protein
MKYIPLTRGSVALVDDEDYDFLMQWKWVESRGYAIRRPYMGKKPNGQSRWGKTIMMHRVINSTPEGLDTDHINRDTLDNRRQNLRSATVSQNMGNQRPQIGKTSSYKGVYLDRGMWRAAIQCNKKGKKLGYFLTEEAAAIAYNEAAKKLFGEFARLNTVPLTVVGIVEAS